MRFSFDIGEMISKSILLDASLEYNYKLKYMESCVCIYWNIKYKQKIIAIYFIFKNKIDDMARKYVILYVFKTKVRWNPINC